MDEIMTLLIIAILLALIPAYIAKNKGYSFFSWWVYGFLIFIVAIIHVCFIPNKKKLEENIFNELKRYKKLLEEGIIEQSEYELKISKLKNKYENIKNFDT